MRRVLFLTTAFFVYFLVLSGFVQADVFIESFVNKSHLSIIQSLFIENNLSEASVVVDQYGRAQLRGNYKDKKEVELAFSLAQSVVGISRVSPVTPENIKVKEWAKKLSGLFPTKKVYVPPAPTETNDTSDVSPKKYALVVGISRYKNRETYKLLNKGEELNLKYADTDAQGFNSYLIDPKHGNFQKENVYLLLNEAATTSNIRDALMVISKKSRLPDEVVIYVSSHGISGTDWGMNILTYDADVSSTFAAKQTSFYSENLNDFIKHTKAKKIVVILDVCFSGNAFKNIKGFYHTKSNTDFENDNQGISRTVMAKTLLGAKDVAFEDDSVIVQKVNPEATRVLISASDQGQRSWESDKIQAGYFSNYLVKGLKDEKSLEQAFKYAKPNVIKNVKEEKKADQHPQIYTEIK